VHEQLVPRMRACSVLSHATTIPDRGSA
jgi:hypothetical protein